MASNAIQKMASTTVKNSVKLFNGFEIPLLGLGTWKAEPAIAIQAVKDAIDVGYRHFDCAYFYANEHEIGIGLNAKIQEGVVKREDLFITSKLWNTFHRPDLVIPACKMSLKNLGLDYLDLYLIHWPMAFKENDDLIPIDENGKIIYSEADYLETWPEMEKLVQMGLVRSIGISNFNSQQIKRILNIATIRPAVNQVECHPYLNQRKLLEFCKLHNIVITAYSPLGSCANRPWAKPGEPVLLEDNKLKNIASRLGRTTAQIVLRFQVQRGIVVIPKTVHKNRMVSNSQIFDLELSKEDMDYLYSMDYNGRILDDFFVPKTHKDYPFGIEF